MSMRSFSEPSAMVRLWIDCSTWTRQAVAVVEGWPTTHFSPNRIDRSLPVAVSLIRRIWTTPWPLAPMTHSSKRSWSSIRYASSILSSGRGFRKGEGPDFPSV